MSQEENRAVKLQEVEVTFKAVGQVGSIEYELVPVKKAAEIMHVHPMTIRMWIHEGKLIAHKFSYMWFVYPQLIKSLPKFSRQPDP